MIVATTEMLAEVERRIEAANKTVKGADHKAIVRAVAEENGVDYEDFKNDCLDAWVQGGAG